IAGALWVMPVAANTGPVFAPMSRLYIFFFQAEDGIRDGHVTGVQTCALPIFEPPMSLPNSRGVSPAASAAAPPPVEPPGVRPRSQGLLVRPYTGLFDCQSDSIWGTFVFAMTTAPAPCTRIVTGASCSDRKSFHVNMPAVVRSPRTLMDSFRVIGRPSSGASSP